MSESNIVIGSSSEDGEHLSISFTRKSFTDFIYSLVSTPREERKTLEVGFDLDKKSLRLMIDRLHQHVKTNYDAELAPVSTGPPGIAMEA